ncbi:hypothetical protein JCM3775_004669 [Rhodotorula graminis]|uniref:Uncharacterized protein n=1 Tax=Rhodotorula graminis (strain WP1) TaxID=578459 RepID=A0A0P9F1Y9_RHOGW|nr:uncharacterized protein RHOBADRAFT_54891 [Rhodotorula graminis WP1]KPV73697.1 hypothetical protein RHOBADRAFT_54891 [Rhodotorula graminis WP1]
MNGHHFSPVVLSPSPEPANDATPRLGASPAIDLATLARQHNFCVIGGGTGCNAVLAAFADAERTTFIVPVSDDGGSSSEVQRVLGGPALGDIRSRLIRLIPPSPLNSPLDCIRKLLEYRLPGEGSGKSHAEVKGEWHEIVEGTHKLWRGIPGDRKETIRAFLVHFESAVLKKAQRGFNFKKASIGNLFLSGASLFLGSVPSAIFLFASLTGIAHDRVRIVPVINTSSTVTIAAELEDGQIIAGQSEISHPSATTSAALEHGVTTPAVGSYLGGGGGGLKPESYFPLTRATTPSFPEPPVLGAEEDDSHSELPFAPSPDPNSLSAFASAATTHAPTLLAPSPAAAATAPASRNLEFTKDSHAIAPLPARIRRIFYLNAYGSEIWPRPNTVFLNALRDATCLVYAPGSLYTSIVPCVALRPVGELIARGVGGRLRYKVLLLNATEDRETPAYAAGDFVRALTDACARSFDGGGPGEGGQVRCVPRDVVTHVVWVRNGQVEVDERELVALGIESVAVGPTADGLFSDDVVREALGRIFSCSSPPS